MIEKQSGYVLAGFETINGIFKNFMNNTKGRWDEQFTVEQLNNFLSKKCYGYLHSYGQNFPDKKNIKNHNKDEAMHFIRAREFGILKDALLKVDSGGFQIAVGRLSRKQAKSLFELYYEFLEEYVDVYDRAFILDIPPGESCRVLKDFDDLYDWNYRSYTKAAELPDNVREKIIYIHHFRSPRLWDVSHKILKESDLYERFNHFGTGGIVASMRGDINIPCIIYVIPLVTILNETIKHNRNYLDFHVLGGSSFRDVFFYELFKILIKKKHNIDLNITYDSAGLYKAGMMARYIHVVEGNQIKKLDIRTNALENRFLTSINHQKKFFDALNDMAIRNGFKTLNENEIYGESTFHEEVKVYMMLYCLELYETVQLLLKEKAIEIYKLYEEGNFEEFNIQSELITRNINEGKITRKQRAKSNSIIKSLDLLTDLDEDYCLHVVKRCLARDEFVNLINDEKLIEV